MENFKSLKRRLERIEEVLSPTEEDTCHVVIYVPGTHQPLPGYEQAALRPGVVIWIPDNGRDGYGEGYEG